MPCPATEPSDLLNFRFGYVPISRASHDTMPFTNVAKLSPQLNADVSKTSALVLPQQSIFPGICMGI